MSQFNYSSNSLSQYKKVALLGATRGLGRAFHHLLLEENFSRTSFFLSARKENLLKEMSQPQDRYFVCDFSRPDQVLVLLDQLANFSPDLIVYFAGGGPYGFYQQKKWSDHVWAHQVTFLTPAQIIHFILNRDEASRSVSTKIVVIGSKVADSQPDPQAASYCASKQALRALVETLHIENPLLKSQVIFFRPPYMQTEMLPPNAWPRQQGLAESPQKVARDLLQLLIQQSV